MDKKVEKYNQIKEFLEYQDIQSILIYALSHRNLAKLVNKMKLNSRDIKTTQIPTEDLADLLAKGAFSNQNIFKEVRSALDLYSAEAVKAVNNGHIAEFRQAIFKDKGQRRKANMARLIWALLMDASTEKIIEGKKLISELTYRDKHIGSDKTDIEDGKNIEDRERQTKIKKRQRDVVLRGKPEKSSNPNFELVTSRLKSEIDMLKKKNAKLLHQIQNFRESIKIKDMGKKIKLLEKENKDIKETINRDYVPKDELDALKKETDRLHNLYKASNKAIQKGSIEKEKCPVDDASLWERFKNVLSGGNPLIKNRLFMKRGKNCRVGIFVDVQNMFYSAKNLYHGRLDFEKFLELALNGRKLVKATAYIVKTPEIDQSKFINLLKNNEYEVKTIDLKTGMNGYAKGNWDVGMVMDIFELADKLDVIALASGDGDFVPLVKYLQKRGIRVEVYAFAYNTAIDLKECADKFYPLQENILIKDQRGVVKQH